MEDPLILLVLLKGSFKGPRCCFLGLFIVPLVKEGSRRIQTMDRG